MKKIVQGLLYLIIVILVLEVIKTIVAKRGGDASFFIGYVLASLQMLILIGFILFTLIYTWSKKRFSHHRKALGLALMSTIILIGGMEGVCAIWLHHSDKLPSFLIDAFDYYYNTYDRHIIQFERNSSVYDPKLFYTLKPNARFNYSNVEFDNLFTTNRLGVRDDERSLEKPAVICLGDSYGMGWGVDQDSTYAQQLERLSGKKILNAAVSSYGTAREIINLNRLDTSGLTHLIIQYYENDFEENTEYVKNHEVLPISSREEYEKTVRSEQYNGIYYPGKYFLNISQIFIKQSINKIVPVFTFKKSGFGPEVTDIKHARLFLDVFSHAPIDFSKVKTIVVYPGKYEGKIHAFETLTDSLLQVSPYKERFGNNVRILKVSQLLKPADYYILDVHLRDPGHRKIAQALWEMMQTF